jgi:hypothetical protein
MAKDSELVLAFFEDEAAADRAAASFEDWVKASRHAKIDAVGVLVKDANGEIKTHKLGPRQTSRGMGIGVALGVVAAVASGGITLFEGVAVGSLGGAGLGFLFHRGLGMTGDDAQRISGRLDQGHAAVGVIVIPAQAQGVTDKLAELGGEPEVHAVSSEDLASAPEELAKAPTAAT